LVLEAWVSSSEFGSLILLLLVVVGLAHVLGHAFAHFRQPRVVGEIVAGILIGPALLGRFAPHLSASLFSSGAANEGQIVLGFLSSFGLLLLMFASGAETKGLFDRQDRREVGWLGVVGTGLPFLLALVAAPLIPTAPLIGTAGQRTSLLIVVSIAMAVTSIPVISKILHDLGILNTRFARLILGVAVMEDIVLWGVLAVATALAKSGSIPQQAIALHVLYAVMYFTVGLTVMPHLLAWVSEARWNVLAKASPVGYVVLVLLAYCAAATLLDVNLVFAAFLAGYALVARTDLFEDAMRSISKVSFAVFIPVYFVVVGYQLDLTKSFSLTMLLVFLAVGCAAKLLCAGLGARLAGFNWRDSVNLSMALNARGGPGIVLASVAFGSGIINAAFYTTLVLFAVLTSQVAGAWLDYVLRAGIPLLTERNTITIVTPPEPARATTSA
jgi:Kef-type K+ transport system membrane component KefB